MNCCLIIPAGGSGKRFGDEKPKQFHLLGGVPLIIRTIKAFENIDSIKSVVVAVNDKYYDELSSLADKYQISKNLSIVRGGTERQYSVYNALQTESASSSDLVLIHDAVRPFIATETIEKLIAFAAETGGAVPAIMPKDTVRELLPSGAYKTLPRERLRLIQTPQVFRTDLILKAFAKAKQDNFISTDDAAVFEYYGYDYIIAGGDENNFKITTKTDFELAEAIIKKNNEFQ